MTSDADKARRALDEACKAMLWTAGDPLRWIEAQGMARAAIAMNAEVERAKGGEHAAAS